MSFLALRNAVAPDSGPCGIQVFQLLNYDQDAAGYVPILAGALKDLGSNSCGTQENQVHIVSLQIKFFPLRLALNSFCNNEIPPKNKQIFRFGPLYSAYSLMIKVPKLKGLSSRL